MEKSIKTDIQNRIVRAQNHMGQEGIDCFIVQDSDNIRYLSGYTGEFAILILFQDSICLISHYRNNQKIKREVVGIDIELVETGQLIQHNDLIAAAKKLILDKKAGNIAVEDHLSYQSVLDLRKTFKPIKVKLSDLIEKLRMIKSEYEIQLLETAQRKAENILDQFLPMLKPGQTEKHYHHQLLRLIYDDVQLEGPSFLPIIASSESSWTIHPYYTDRVLRKGDSVVIDMGVFYQGYCSDMTRTVFLGAPSTRQEAVYNIVLEAQNEAESTIKPGILNHTVDASARKVISQAGYGEYFSHGLGHGIGLNTHEAPFLSYQKKRCLLRQGMTFSIEPGIYIENEFGVRIEDMVIVTETGCRNLTHYTKEIISL
ncbi:MAG TPA: hypothetical protein DCO79_14535 [Spirochaeta sp.]|nr:hypothetical protein [Spirochaeta sp.]